MDGLDALCDRDDLPYCEETAELDAAAFETVREAIEAEGIECWVRAVVRDGRGRVVLVRNR